MKRKPSARQAVVLIARLTIGFAATVVSGASSAQEAMARFRSRPSPARKPANVPSDFVLTRAGFMHPTCVVTVASDETVGRDGNDMVVRDMDGRELFRKGPCAYPRYRRDGQLAASVAGPAMRSTDAGGASDATTASDAGAPTGTIAHGTYDGWIVSYRSEGSFDPRSTLVGEWRVPELPAKVGDQDIAFFNDVLTTADGGDILQPVLDFSELPGTWAIESEHCCISGNDSQSTLVAVKPGDLIRGTVAPSNCDSTGLCRNWKVTTLDVTTGQFTINNAIETSGRAIAINPAALECYGVTSCDMFPANGEITFFNHSLRSPDGATATLTDTLNIVTRHERGSTVPFDCGYDGHVSGTSYTLVWAPIHHSIAGGGASDNRDGSGHTSSGSGGSPAGAVSASGGTVASSDMTSPSGQGGIASSGGATGAGGTSSSSGTAAETMDDAKVASNEESSPGCTVGGRGQARAGRALPVALTTFALVTKARARRRHRH